MSDNEKDKSAHGPEGPRDGAGDASASAPGPATPDSTGVPSAAPANPPEGGAAPEAAGPTVPLAEAKPVARARAAAGPDPVEAALRAVVPSVPLERLRSRFADLAAGASFCGGVPIVKVPAGSIVEVCRFLKEDAEADMKYLSNLHATHHPDRPKPLEVVYNLYSITRSHWLELKVEIGETEDVPSVSGVWKTAIWHEREAFDLVGVRFSDHPDLTRILLPDTWTGHPLRKEYPLEGKEGDHASYR